MARFNKPLHASGLTFCSPQARLGMTPAKSWKIQTWTSSFVTQLGFDLKEWNWMLHFLRFAALHALPTLSFLDVSTSEALAFCGVKIWQRARKVHPQETPRFKTYSWRRRRRWSIDRYFIMVSQEVFAISPWPQ